MDKTEIVWKVLTLLVAVLTAIVPAYVAYDVYGRGVAPPKKVELDNFSSIDPMKDLSDLGDRVSLSLQIEDQTIDNLVIGKSFIKNVGSSPILPSEFHEKLSVSVQKPWKIVAVENSKELFKDIQVRWKRVSDTKFEAEPILLNPGDLIATHVYLTNLQYRRATAKEQMDPPKLEWKARITNLRSFHHSPSLLDRMSSRGRWIDISLSGWAVVYTIVSALLFQALYLHLLSRIGILSSKNTFAIASILAVSFLSLAAAESSATYLFGNLLTEMVGVDHWVNAPWILLHIVVLIFLFRRAPSGSV